MSKTLEVLAVAGFRIHLADGSDYWKLIDAIAEIANVRVTEWTWDDNDSTGMADNDLIGKDAVICYSWGVATVFKAFDRLKAAGQMPHLPMLIILAGVPRGLAQCIEVTASKGWIIPDEVDEALCEQVNSFPVSWPIANPGPTRINVIVGNLPGLDHVSIQNAPAVHDQVVAVISAEAMALSA